MAGSDDHRGRSMRLGAEDQRWSSTGRVLGGWTIERSDDTVCGLHRAYGNEECGFLGLASKPRLTVSPSLFSKPMATVSWFDPQNQGRWFGDLGLKITTMVSWFGPQNQVRGGLSVCASKLMSG
jgi:hypothetical protein